MAALTDVKNDLFGAIGVQDPEIFKTGIAIKRVVNFRLTKLEASKNYAFLPVPAGFVMTGVYVKEMKDDGDIGNYCSAGTLTLKTKADPTKTLGAAVTVGSSTPAEKFLTPVAGTTAKDSSGSGTVSVPGGALAFVASDMICLVASAAMAMGAVEVIIHGYLMNGGSLNASALEVPYREGQSAADYDGNKSGGDLYLKKVAAGA